MILAGLNSAFVAVLVAMLGPMGTEAGVVRRDAVPISLPFVRQVNMTGVPNIVKQDQARAKMLKARGNPAGSAGTSTFQQAAVFDVSATNQAVDYVTTVRLSLCTLWALADRKPDDRLQSGEGTVSATNEC